MVWVPEGKFSMGTAGFAKRLPCAKALCRLRDHRRSCAERSTSRVLPNAAASLEKRETFSRRHARKISRTTGYSSLAHPNPILPPRSPNQFPSNRSSQESRSVVCPRSRRRSVRSLVNAFKETVWSSDTRALALADHDSALWPALCFTPAETASLDLGRLKRPS